MESNGADLTAFPIIRLDQISLLGVDLLHNAVHDVESMLHGGDSVNPKMQAYLHKQVDAMKKEIIKRNAESRISDLLNGAKMLLDTDYSEFDEHIKPAKQQVDKPAPKTSYQPVRMANVTSYSSNSSSRQQPASNAQGAAVSDKKLVHSSSAPAVASSAQSMGLQLPLAEVAADHPSSPKSMASSRSSRSRATISHDDAQPSKKSVEIVNRQFSSEFIVAATEKKKRFYPAKKLSAESIEEQKKKEKQDRRKQAMERLMKRRQERQDFQIALKEQRRREKLAQRQAEQLAAVPDDDGSESESVSGGDDDHGHTEDKNQSQGAEALVLEVPLPVAPLHPEQSALVLPMAPLAAIKAPEKNKTTTGGKSVLKAPSSSSVAAEKSQRTTPSTSTATAPSGSTRAPKGAERGSQRSTSQSKPQLSAATTDGCQTSSRDPPQPDEQPMDDANDAIAADADMSGELADKNLAALTAIRRMKEMKAKMRSSSLKEVVTSIQTAPDICLDMPAVQIEQALPDNDALTAMQDSPMAVIPSSHTPRDTHVLLLENTMQEMNCAVHDVVANDQQQQLHGCAIFDIVGDVYVFKHTAEQLPGLCAWKLDQVASSKVTWKVDVGAYTASKLLEKDEKVFSYLSQSRRTIPMGLIVLAEECQSILIGDMTISTAQAFLQSWSLAIDAFDNKACELSVSNIHVLNQLVAVCGNGYNICKKIEYLIKTHFISKEEQGVIDAMSSDVDQTPSDGMQLWLDAAVAQQEGEDEEENREEEREEDVEVEEETKVVEEVEEEEEVPVGIVASSRRPSIGADAVIDASSSAIRPVSSQAAIPILRALPDPTPVMLVQHKLTDYYPHFGMIFPLAFAMVSSRPESWRVLHDSMKACLEVHEEWLEVMKDYSTVFCTNLFDQPPANAAVNSSSSRSKRIRPVGADNAIDKAEAAASTSHGSEQVYNGTACSLHYRIKSQRSEVNNILTDAFNAHFSQTYSSLPNNLGLGLTWNFLWTWSKPHIKPANYNTLLVWQRLNHFMNSKQLTRKDLLKKNIEKFVNHTNKAVGKEFDIMPVTYLLPNEYTQFVQAFTQHEIAKKQQQQQQQDGSKKEGPLHLNYWILKPVGLSRGRGISLIKDLGDLSYATTCIVQKYIENPLCLYNYKFDLRLYVVVLSFTPLEVYIYKDGFARVSTEEYNLDPNSTNNLFIHLTNSSIQKYNNKIGNAYSNMQRGDQQTSQQEGEDGQGEAEDGGSKIPLLGQHGLWHLLQQVSASAAAGASADDIKSQRVDVDAMWSDICLLVVKSLCILNDKIPSQPNAFELFGYDVIFDDTMRPWLLEVNASPSLSRDNQLDHKVKNQLIHDIIKLMDVVPYNREKLVEVLRKRLLSKSYMNIQSFMKQQQQQQQAAAGYAGQDPELEADLRAILGDRRPRRYDELPADMGQFQRLAPDSKYFQQVMKLKRKIVKTE